MLFQKLKQARPGQTGESTGFLLAAAGNQHQLFQIPVFHVVSEIVNLGETLMVNVFKGVN